MQRRLSDLADREFDVLVVGGGICGLTIACDAAQRGLSVALIERHDFGSGTSFNHLRTIHGGLRYLQHLDLARARESIRERRTLARIAPWAVRPTPFVLPLDRSLTRGSLAMRAGFLLDGLIAGDRNLDLPSSLHLPAGEVLSARAAVARFPALNGVPLSAVAVWHDYVAEDADRLTFAWAQAAASHGAVVANYVEATSLITNRERLVGVQALDTRATQTFSIQARTIVNATGSTLDSLLAPEGLATRMAVTKAMNLVTNIAVPPAAIGGRTATGRNLFMVPWQGRAVFGTWESGSGDRPDDRTIATRDVEAFLGEVRTAFPSLSVHGTSVTLVHRGVVPAVKTARGTSTPDGHEQIHDHARVGHPEIISVAGTKYTTARAVAEKVVAKVLSALGKDPVPCRTATAPLPVPPVDTDARLRAADRVMVETLEDAVVRRTTLGAMGLPSADALVSAAAIVGERLGWNDETRVSEVAAVRGFYDTLAPQ